MKLKFISESYGVSKSGKPFHFVKLADPVTFENHQIAVDPAYLQAPLNIRAGSDVEIAGRLSTPYNSTQFVLTHIKVLKDSTN